MVAVEEHHKQEVQLLKHEHEEKLKQLKNKNDYLKHQLENSNVLNQQQANQIAILEKQLKESHLASVASSFSILIAEEFKQLACRLHDQFYQSMVSLYAGFNEM